MEYHTMEWLLAFLWSSYWLVQVGVRSLSTWSRSLTLPVGISGSFHGILLYVITPKFALSYFCYYVLWKYWLPTYQHLYLSIPGLCIPESPGALDHRFPVVTILLQQDPFKPVNAGISWHQSGLGSITEGEYRWVQQDKAVLYLCRSPQPFIFSRL